MELEQEILLVSNQLIILCAVDFLSKAGLHNCLSGINLQVTSYKTRIAISFKLPHLHTKVKIVLVLTQKLQKKASVQSCPKNKK